MSTPNGRNMSNLQQPKSKSSSISLVSSKKKKRYTRGRKQTDTTLCSCAGCLSRKPHGVAKSILKRTYRRHNSVIDSEESSESPIAVVEADLDYGFDQGMGDDIEEAPIITGSGVFNGTHSSSVVISDDYSSDPDLPSDSSESEDDVTPPLLPPVLPRPGFAPESFENVPKVGRPVVDLRLDESLFLGSAGKLGAFLCDLIKTFNEFNVPDRFREKMHLVFRNHINSKFPSYYRSTTMIKNANHKDYNYPACEKDCYVHNKVIGMITPIELKALKCPICKSDLTDEKGRVKKMFYYVGLRRRLTKCLEDPVLSPYLLLPLPVTPDTVDPTRVNNIYESKAWKNHVENGAGRDITQHTTFGTENNRRNIVLAMNVDGFQPWRRIGRCLTPLVCMILNLPENLRHRAEYLLLAGLIPGPNEPKEMNAYMQMLIQELNELYTEEGAIEFQDPLLPPGAPKSKSRVKLLNICGDLPALGALLYQQVQAAYQGCIKCYLKGYMSKSCRSLCYGKYKSLEVPPADEERKEPDVPLPRLRGFADTVKWINMRTRYPDEKVITREDTRGIYGRSVLYDLVYFDPVRDCLLDMMHLTSGIVGRHLMKAVNGKRLKNIVNEAKRHKKTDSDIEEEEENKRLEEEKQCIDDAKKEVAERLAINKLDKQILDARGEKYNELVDKRNKKEEKSRERQNKRLALDQRKQVRAENIENAQISLADFDKRWKASDERALLVEQACYRSISGPRGIAPRTKRPLSCSSEMHAHHWVNFTKAYGSYLLKNALFGSNDSVWGATKLLAIVKMCLASSVSDSFVQTLRDKIADLAADIDNYFPENMKSMVLHLLMFHMPDTIAYWGPARGYWCFAFERYIAKLGRSIGSKKHPEANLINRYLQDVEVRQMGSDIYETVDVDDEVEDEDDVHPLVPLGAVNSTLLRLIQTVRYPRLTKSNSRRMYKKLADSHLSQRVFSPLLGSEVVQRNHRRSNLDWKVYVCWSPVYVGPWKFTCKSLVLGYEPGLCHAYFAIRARWIPAIIAGDHLGPRYDPDELLFGQFHQFLLIETPHWSQGDQIHHVGECTLWRCVERSALDDLAMIDMDQIIMAQGKKVQYVPLQHLETLVALSREVTGWKDRGARSKQGALVESNRFYAMPLQV